MLHNNTNISVSTSLINIIKYLFFGFSFFLSFKTTISNFFVILILISFLIIFFLSKEKTINYSIIIHSFFPLFIFSLFSLLWSTNISIGIDLIQKNLFLFLIPLVFSITPLKNNKIYLKYSYYGLLIGSILVAVLLLWKLEIRLLALEKITISKVFSSYQTNYKYASALVKIHPSYLGLYSLFSIAILLFNKIKIKIITKIVMFLILITNLLFLNVRILFFLLSFLLILRVFSIKSIKTKGFIFLIISLLSIFGFVLLKDTYIYTKLIKGSQWEISNNTNTYNTSKKYKSDPRLARWKSILNGTENKRIIGYGIGSEMDVVLPIYIKNKLITSYSKKFNTHNQYLYYLITMGFIGLILFLYLLLWNIFISIKNKDFIMFYFFIMLFFMSLVENVMYRNAGFIFIAIYISLYNKQYLHK